MSPINFSPETCCRCAPHAASGGSWRCCCGSCCSSCLPLRDSCSDSCCTCCRRCCGRAGGASLCGWRLQLYVSILSGLFEEVLNGVGLDGVGGIFLFLRFSSFLFVFLFFVFLRFFLLCFALFFVSLPFSPRSPGRRANNCNLLGKWGLSLRPGLHRPRSELPEP